MKHYKDNFKECPICKMNTFSYKSYSDEYWGAIITVEQHGYCDSCGYTVEQAYSDTYDGFWDVKKGFKHPYGYYVEKNVRRHKRHRRNTKINIKNIEVNPEWIKYI